MAGAAELAKRSFGDNCIPKLSLYVALSGLAIFWNLPQGGASLALGCMDYVPLGLKATRRWGIAVAGSPDPATRPTAGLLLGRAYEYVGGSVVYWRRGDLRSSACRGRETPTQQFRPFPSFPNCVWEPHVHVKLRFTNVR